MEITYINTLDGKTKIEWWDKEHFRNRNTEIYSASGVHTVIPIPDDVILCDFCNERIEEFPVPVMGTYALCKSCFEEIKKEEGNHAEV